MLARRPDSDPAPGLSDDPVNVKSVPADALPATLAADAVPPVEPPEAARRRATPEDWPRDSLRAGRVIGGGDDFGRIAALRFVRGFLFVGDSYMVPHGAVVDLATGVVLDRVGGRGEGPKEFQNPTGLAAAGGASPAVWVHDFYTPSAADLRSTRGKRRGARPRSSCSCGPGVTRSGDPRRLRDLVLGAGGREA